MDDNALEKLLIEAGESLAPPPDLPDDLARRIRVLRRRRRHWKIGAGSAALVAALVAAAVWQPWMGGPMEAPQPDTARAAQIAAQVDALQDRADQAQAALDALLARQRGQTRLVELRRRLLDIDTAEPLQRRFDAAAGRLLMTADRLASELDDPAKARELYNQVIDQFPDSPAAQIAQARIGERQSYLGESL